MCNKWHSVEKDIGPCRVKIYGNPYGNIVVSGETKDILGELNFSNDIFVKYWAANRPNYGISFAGGGLPFPNEHIAFQDTDNAGVADVIFPILRLNSNLRMEFKSRTILRIRTMKISRATFRNKDCTICKTN